MNRIWSYLQSRSSRAVIALGTALVLALGAVEWAAGDLGTLWTLYLAPVAIAAWLARERGAAAATVATAAVWMVLGAAGAAPGGQLLDRLVQVAVLASAGVAVSAWSRSVSRQIHARHSGVITGLANAAAFFHHLDTEHARAQRYGRPFTVAHIGIGNLRAMRQRAGGEATEALIRAAASVLSTRLRAGDVVARLRGGEFAVLLTEADMDGATVALNRTLQRLQALTSEMDPAAAAHFNIGAISCTGTELPVEQLFQRVYQLMYTARQDGPGVVRHEQLEPELAAVA